MTIFTIINQKYRNENLNNRTHIEIVYKHFEYVLTVITTQGLI